MNTIERIRLRLAIRTLAAALRLLKEDAAIGMSRAKVQLLDSAIAIAEDELEDADADA